MWYMLCGFLNVAYVIHMDYIDDMVNKIFTMLLLVVFISSICSKYILFLIISFQKIK